MASLREFLEGKRFGLVMSAGFFGFYGHAGFYAGLRELGLSPAAYAGSSAGGLVAALAGAGMSPERIVELLFNLKRSDFWDPDPLGALWAAAKGGHAGSGILRGNRFQQLLEQHLPIRNLEDCKVPVALAATNLTTSEVEIFRTGALAPRIHATCAYPGLFRAVDIGGQLYWDGGLVDKAPVLALADAKDLELDAILVHYLPSRGRDRLGGWFAYAQGLDIGMAIARRDHFKLQVEVAEARGLPVHVVVSELPAVSPTKMHKGKDAVAAARERASSALAAGPEKFMARG
ncbi:MAG: patatin-like phospholipase family protein [Deltaproteobacteria bacterium]|nr:patatin-like phospholipase family protein [Deltaproteobacteria bacterium]